MRTVGRFPPYPRSGLVVLVAVAPPGPNFVDGGRATDLVAGYHQRPSVRAVLGVDEDESFGTKVACFGLARSRSDGEVAVVDVLNKLGAVGLLTSYTTTPPMRSRPINA